MKIRRTLTAVLIAAASTSAALAFSVASPAGATASLTTFCGDATATPSPTPTAVASSITNATVGNLTSTHTPTSTYVTVESQFAPILAWNQVLVTAAPSTTLRSAATTAVNATQAATNVLNEMVTVSEQLSQKSITSTAAQSKLTSLYSTLITATKTFANDEATLESISTSACTPTTTTTSQTAANQIAVEDAALVARDAQADADDSANAKGVVPPANNYVASIAKEQGLTVAGNAQGWTITTSNGGVACLVIPSGVNTKFTTTPGACAK